MQRRSGARTRAVGAFTLAVLVGAAVHAGTVYKSVDAEGKVSYSDVPPPAGVPVEVIETPDSGAADPGAADRLEQMRETTERMRADRLAREDERRQREESLPYYYPSPPPYDEEADDRDERWLLPYYPPYHGWHDDDRPHRPHPRPPLVEPEPLPSGTDSASPRGLKARLRAAR